MWTSDYEEVSTPALLEGQLHRENYLENYKPHC